MKIKFALGLVLLSAASQACGANPNLPPYCVSFYFVEGGNRTQIIDAYVEVISGPEMSAGRLLSYGSNSVSTHLLCRGTSEVMFGHADFLPTRLTYTSPRDRDPQSNNFTDVVAVTLVRR
ncbi:MAG: hypothetical protein Q8Q09_14240 [Deltaproteobacteria bacterium]|nr:hypothetical protein [Deltaproteobacteria bacterium]